MKIMAISRADHLVKKRFGHQAQSDWPDLILNLDNTCKLMGKGQMREIETFEFVNIAGRKRTRCCGVIQVQVDGVKCV